MLKITKVKYMQKYHKNQLDMVKVWGNRSPLFAIVAIDNYLRAQAVFVSKYEKFS